MLWFNRAYWDATTVQYTINIVYPLIVVQADDVISDARIVKISSTCAPCSESNISVLLAFS
jgi:hypothetical protein